MGTMPGPAQVGLTEAGLALVCACVCVSSCSGPASHPRLRLLELPGAGELWQAFQPSVPFAAAPPGPISSSHQVLNWERRWQEGVNTSGGPGNIFK